VLFAATSRKRRLSIVDGQRIRTAAKQHGCEPGPAVSDAGEPLPSLTIFVLSISHIIVHNSWLAIPVFIAFHWLVLFHGERFAPQPLIAVWWW
jgi:hypothetical protein